VASANQISLVRRIERAGAVAALVLGLFTAVSTLKDGVWLDEFFTLGVAQQSNTFGAFLGQMRTEVHPLGHYGLIALAHTLGVTDIASLRALGSGPIKGIPLAVGL
jgi:hypothetical protein